MTSRELIELLENMPDDSAFKRALDGYPFGVERDWTRAEYFAARLIAETAASRGGEFDPTGIVSPIEEAISKMRKDGTWPPAWWTDEQRKAAIESDAGNDNPGDPAAAERAAMPTDAYDALHNQMIDQLYGRT